MRPARLALLLGLLVPFAPFDPAGANADHAVSITASGYSPATVSIRPNDTVTWHNDDNKAHTATSDDNGKTFNSGPIPAGGKAQILFTQEGTFPYHDEMAPGHTGTLVVSSTAPTTSTSSTTIPPPRSTTTTSSTSSTSTSSTSTSTSTTTVTFPLGTVPEPSSTTSSTDALIVPVDSPAADKTSTPTGPGLAAAVLLMATSGATLLVMRRGR
jgi:plastocyanin